MECPPEKTIKQNPAEPVLESIEIDSMETVEKQIDQKTDVEHSQPIVGGETRRRRSRMLRFLDVPAHGKEEEAWNAIEKRFHQRARDGKLTRDKFGSCIWTKKELAGKESANLAVELYDVLARRRDVKAEKGISLQELKGFWEDLTNDEINSRLQLFFDLCDKDGDGKISREEVKIVLKWSASANKLKTIEKQVDSFASLIMENLDPDGNGFIEIEHMEDLVKEMWSSDELQSKDSELQVSSFILGRCRSPGRRFLWETKEAFIENWKRVWVLALWLSINLALFVWKFMEYRNKGVFKIMGYCVSVAKGAAETLKFNMALILFLVCRGTLTRLRSSFLNSVIPFDDHIHFHMTVAVAIGLGTFLHVVMHMACDFPRLISCPNSEFMAIVGPIFKFKKPSYLDLVASVPGVTGIVMVIIMSFCFILATPLFRKHKENLPPLLQHLAGFNAFWYAHHLLVLCYVLLIFHGYYLILVHEWYKKTTWMYIAVPVLLYVSERLIIKFNQLNHHVKVKKGLVYEGNALALYLEKPEGFKYESGMYLFVKCTDISKFEWHPFSITSAPGDNYLSVHIRAKGDWTGELIKRFENVCEPGSTTRRGLVRRETKSNFDYVPSESRQKHPQIQIKGPYGAPAQSYKNFDTLLLIGLGIGATPMISILKDLLNNIKTNGSGSAGSQKFSQKAYFYWVTSEQSSFDWFKGVLDDVAEHDHDNVIEMHIHLSCVHKEGDVRSVFITMLQKIQQSRGVEVDVLSGSRVRTTFGRPEWEKVFQRLASDHKGSEIGVFYCGDYRPVKDLRRHCKNYSESSTSTRFRFHKENF